MEKESTMEWFVGEGMRMGGMTQPLRAAAKPPILCASRWASSIITPELPVAIPVEDRPGARRGQLRRLCRPRSCPARRRDRQDLAAAGLPPGC